ncbi:Programmed cell death protein 5 [Cyberlindnera fabianii]|uniref:Programmed cell death protein 5 n=1 Tax=Cyberlindnera fabianii TaxID=36022 RepID=A0A1V2LAU4_CYBFA|nr:Programmed cell death protein 5 [Cyberlindnera fabianii]
MDDAELEAIRAARLKELQKSSGQGGSQEGQSSGLSAALDQVLEPAARERLSRVNMVRPDRAKAVEQYIMRLAQSGQVRRKLGESDIVEILNGLARDEQKKNETTIVFSRKQTALDEDDDDDDFFD